MNIAVIGAGAIGSLVAGYLKLNGQEVSLAGHADSVGEIAKNGLAISGVRGGFNLKLPISERLDYKPDLVIIATKTQDIPEALEENIDYIRNTRLLTTQNGVCADEIASGFLGRQNIFSSIVMFGATCLAPGRVVHNFEGSWIIGPAFKENLEKAPGLTRVLDKAFPVIIKENLSGMKYLKIFVNANNCLPAILGLSMQEAFSDPEVSRISIALWREGLDIVTRSNINLESLPDFPLERLQKLTSLPSLEAAKIYSGIMSNLSKEPLYGSVLQSIKRGRPSEIDYLNGEFVRLAKETNSGSPLNGKLVEMVHQVEKNGAYFSKEQLISAVKGLVN